MDELSIPLELIYFGVRDLLLPILGWLICFSLLRRDAKSNFYLPVVRPVLIADSKLFCILLNEIRPTGVQLIYLILLPKIELVVLSSSTVVLMQGSLLSSSLSFKGVGFVSLPRIWSKAMFVWVVSSNPGVTYLSKNSMPLDLHVSCSWMPKFCTSIAYYGWYLAFSSISRSSSSISLSIISYSF